MEMATNRPIPERNWYQWFNRRIKHISESIKKCESETKQKVTRLFVSIIDNNTPTYYDIKTFGEWKILLTMKPTFMSSRDSNEKRSMYSESYSRIAMAVNDTNQIQELLIHFSRNIKKFWNNPLIVATLFVILCFRNAIFVQLDYAKP